jgi:hypothetical protein
MPISPEVVAIYAPHGNMQLTFTVTSNLPPTQNANTGNYELDTEELYYLAAAKLESPRWTPGFGVDPTLYMVKGRLLNPAFFDERVTTGIQAEAVVNGVAGRLELTFDLDNFSDPVANNDLRQRFTGQFRVVGGHQ